MTHSGTPRALPVSTTSLLNVALLVACLSISLSDCLSRSAGGNAALLTEEYTVWPKENDALLSEGYPWKSCNNITGERCPSLSDYIHHFCVDYGNAGCPRKNRILAKNRVILNLLPGEHKITFRQCFKWFGNTETKPQCHLFCNVSELSIRGKHVSETTIMAVKTKVPARLKSDGESVRPYGKPCGWNCGFKDELAEWSAFAFRGGGNVTFQDITFRSPSGNPDGEKENLISAWDLRRFEVQRCHFPELRRRRGALVFLMSKKVTDMQPQVEMIVNDCTFGFEAYVTEPEWKADVFASPAIEVMPLELCGNSHFIAFFEGHGKPSVKLHQCVFQLYLAEDAQCRKR